MLSFRIRYVGCTKVLPMYRILFLSMDPRQGAAQAGEDG
jgi:hypothetical protein